MDADRQRAIRAEARELLVELWNRRAEVWENPPDAEEVVRQAPERVITHLLGARLEKIEEIRPASTESPNNAAFETAGLIDRQQSLIVIAQKFKLEWRRFTTGHEIGHWILHPQLTYHRDRPLNGGERTNKQRPLEEQEADLFAAELLMPTRLLRTVFARSFGGPINGAEPDETLAFRLSPVAGTKLKPIELAARGAMYRALLIAKASSFAAGNFVSLVVRFKVSPTAMAIQLLDLGLVR